MFDKSFILIDSAKLLYLFSKITRDACLFVAPNIIKSCCQSVTISDSIYFCFILFPSYEFFSNSHTRCIVSIHNYSYVPIN